jgi:methylglutaconyl-CoA hydratase
MQQGTLTVNIHAKVAQITLGHPRANALTPALIQEFITTLDRLSTSPEVAVVVLQTEGERAFCGGAALHNLATATTLEEATEFFMGFARLINALRNFPKFVIARVQGKCVGGAVGLVAACDYAFATGQAAVKLSELSIGIGPFVIAPAVQRRIGKSAFAHLSLASTQWHSASWAAQHGLFAKLEDTTTALDTAVKALATQLASIPLDSMATLKALHWKGTEHWDDELADNAKITAKLALKPFTQQILKKLMDK